MRLRDFYPITLKSLKEHPEIVKKVFLKLYPHKGAFISVCELEGCFLCDSPGELYSSLTIGEKLSLSHENGVIPEFNTSLQVKRADGTLVGMLPFSQSLIPNLLKKRNLEVWCHLEAKEFNAGDLALAVSVYCEEY